jgi:hypothetical protein
MKVERPSESNLEGMIQRGGRGGDIAPGVGVGREMKTEAARGTGDGEAKIDPRDGTEAVIDMAVIVMRSIIGHNVVEVEAGAEREFLNDETRDTEKEEMADEKDPSMAIIVIAAKAPGDHDATTEQVLLDTPRGVSYQHSR